MISAPSWLITLDELLRRIGIPVRRILLSQGILKLRMGQIDPIDVMIHPKGSNRPSWAQTSKFDISYDGSRELTGANRHTLTRLKGLLERAESRLPNFDGQSGSIFHDDTPPNEQFLETFPFCAIEYSDLANHSIVEVMIRTTPLCNQRCPFCSAHETIEASPVDVKSCLSAIPKLFPGAMATITGGEPTLRASFLEELQWGLQQEGISRLQIQTNAVAFSTRISAKSINHAEHLSFFVSLHAMDEEIYNACTGTSGQYDQALRGLQNLVEAGHRVTINHVVNALNIEHLEDYLERLSRLFGTQQKPDLHFSVLICPERSPGAIELLVPYARLSKALESAASQAKALGITVQALRSSTHAAIPACMLSEEARSESPHRARIDPCETSFGEAQRPWVKSPTCRNCLESTNCLGVPSPYAARFGLGELEPLQ